MTTVKLADGSIATGKVLDESLVGDDLADETVTGSKIADGTITGSKVEDGTLSGSDVGNDTLEGLDIDEASLDGVALTSGDNCCSLRTETLETETPYSPSDPSTFVRFGLFEVRSSNSVDTIQVCKLASSPGSVTGVVYAGGVRFVPSFPSPSNSCLPFDFNPGSTVGIGDFELILPTGAHVWGKQFFSGDGAEVVILDH